MGLGPGPLFRGNTSIPQLLGIVLLSALGNHFPQGLTPPSRVQPEACDWLMWEYKCLASLLQFGTTLKGHPHS